MRCILIFGKLKLLKPNEAALCYMLDYFQIKQPRNLGIHESEPLSVLSTSSKYICKQAAVVTTVIQAKTTY